jgi:hypothetical protein
MIVINVHTHVLVLLLHRISLMQCHGLFKMSKQVCHIFDRKLLCTCRPTYMYTCTHIHVNNLPPNYPLLNEEFTVFYILGCWNLTAGCAVWSYNISINSAFICQCPVHVLIKSCLLLSAHRRQVVCLLQSVLQPFLEFSAAVGWAAENRSNSESR